MKKNTLLITFFLVCLINYAQVKIGDNSFDLSPFSILELESSDKALLIPRMTTEQRDLSFDQTAPVGLIIFNITTQGFEYFYETPEAEKKWRSIKGLEIYTEIDRPEGGSSGDSYYDPETNTLYAWNSITNMWMPINAVSNNQIVIGDVNPEVGINPEDLMSGIIYYNSLTRGLFITSDTDGDGVYDEWKRVPTRGPTGRPGPEGPPGKNGVAISGRGAPNPNNVPNPIPGDVYVDILTGDIYTYTTNLTWERQTIIVTQLTQDTTTGVITYTDEVGGTSSATVTSLNVDNLLTTGLDGGTLLTSNTLNDALTSVSTVTISEIVSSTLLSSTIQNLETTTVLTQDINNGVISYTDEDGVTTTATVTSFDSGNVITTGSDGGSYISSSSLADIIANSSVSTETITQLISDTLTRETIQNLETTTVLTQDTNNGVITYTDEDGGTATATVTSLDTEDLLITGTDGGTLLDAATLNNALTAVSTNTITQIVSSTLTRETIQNLETTTVLTQDTNNGVITYTDEDGASATATVTSLDTENLLITGTDGGTLLDATTLNNALTAVSTTTITEIVSSTLTSSTVRALETVTTLSVTNTSEFTYTNEQGTEVNFITSKKGSGDPNENNVYGKPGDIYTDTDNGHLYTSDGTIWHAYQVITPYRGSIIDKQIYIAEYAWDAAFVIAGCFEFRLKEYSRNNPPPTGAEFRSGFNNEAMPEFRLAQDISSNVRVNYHIGQYTNGNFYAYSALSTEFTSLNDRTWVHMAPNNLDGMEPRERNEVWLSYPGDPIIYKINFTIITIDDLPISDETKTSVYSIVVERY